MRAKLDGNPIPELHWYKDGKILVSDRYTMKYSESNFGMLIIKEAVEDDEAAPTQYSCVAIQKRYLEWLNFIHTYWKKTHTKKHRVKLEYLALKS